MTARPPLADQLDLQPHPEGGWFRETWRSPVCFQPDGYPSARSAATAIYFLLQPGEESRWHVVRSAELWFWHSGGALALRLGGDGSEPAARDRASSSAKTCRTGQQPQAVVPGGTWQSAVRCCWPARILSWSAAWSRRASFLLPIFLAVSLARTLPARPHCRAAFQAVIACSLLLSQFRYAGMLARCAVWSRRDHGGRGLSYGLGLRV